MMACKQCVFVSQNLNIVKKNVFIRPALHTIEISCAGILSQPLWQRLRFISIILFNIKYDDIVQDFSFHKTIYYFNKFFCD